MLKIRLSWTFLFILCVIPVLGIGQSYANTPDVTLINFKETSICNVEFESGTCPVSPAVDVRLRITFNYGDDLKIDEKPCNGTYDFILPCGETKSFNFSYMTFKSPVEITIEGSDVRVSTGILTPYISSTTKDDENSWVKFNVDYTFTASPPSPMPGGKGQEGAVAPATEPLPLPEDEDGAFYESDDERVYAWFKSVEMCLQYLEPDMCVWPKVIEE